MSLPLARLSQLAGVRIKKPNKIKALIAKILVPNLDCKKTLEIRGQVWQNEAGLDPKLRTSPIMASLIAKKVKGGTYYYSVTHGWVNGKSRIIKQVYLGSADKITQSMLALKSGEHENPTYGRVLEFGAVSALHGISERLGIRKIIDRYAGKRHQGLPVGDSIILAALNRAVGQVSKAAFCHDWFDKTVLTQSFPLANSQNLSSQGFWNNMEYMDQDIISDIETEIIQNIINMYNISTNCLLFDNTNFFTYIDTKTNSKLAKRGKSKEHRSDLQIIGLSLMVSPDFNIPLFHEIYPGNENDPTRFSELIDKLKKRYLKIAKDPDEITLVFDRGNNSASNIENLVSDNLCKFHFIGGLKKCQYGNLLDLADGNYTNLSGSKSDHISAFRTTKIEYNREVTVIVTNNPELFEEQLFGVTNNINKCKKELNNLLNNIQRRINGEIRGGRAYNHDTLKKKIDGILIAEHMKSIFDYEIYNYEKFTTFKYSINENNFDNIKKKVLGKKILFTDRTDWSNEQIVSAYHAQYHVEECFKQMKHTKFLSFKPIRHFTDKHIRIHAFYCVLALILSSILRLEFEAMGHKYTINKLLEILISCKQMINIYSNEKNNMKKLSYTFTKFPKIADDYIKKYNLFDYATSINSNIFK